MTDPIITKVQQQNTDNVASFNAFGVVTLSDGQTVNVQMTMRHGIKSEHMISDFAEFVAFLDHAATQSGVKFWDGKKDKPAEAKTESTSGGYNDKAGTYDDPREFEASILTVTYDKGKEYFKVHGQDGKFPKFPVSIWGEVLEKAGIAVKDIDPKDGFNLMGWTAKYILNDKGNPAKVISLHKPDFA